MDFTMLRLLYLLLRQRARPTRGTSTLTNAAPRRRSAYRAVAAGTAALAGCAILVGLVVSRYPTFARTSLTSIHAQGATLEMRVDAIDSAPLVVYLEVPQPRGGQAQAEPATLVKITSVNGNFEPRFQVAPLAADVELGNRDAIPHNTHVFDGRRTLFNVAVPFDGVRVHKLLGRPGMFEVRCDFHPWMRAWIFVPAGAYHAVIWQPGETALRDIPPGSYALHVWTAAHGETLRTLSFGAGEVKSLQLTGI
jgi:hypothetical protein